MKKNFLLLLLLTLLPLAGWADNYTVKIGAKAANIQFGEGTPTTATPAMFMVLDWGGITDDDSKNFILGEIADNLSVTSERVAGSSLGNYAFTLSVTTPGYLQIDESADYYRVLIEDGSSSGTFKQVKNAEKPYLTSGEKATSLTYTGEALSLLSTLPDAYFGADYAEALVKGLPVEFRVEKGGNVVSDWSTDEPKATDAGTYDVQYRVKEDTRYAFDENAVENIADIQIAKASRTITTVPEGATELVFNREPQQLITTAAVADGDVLYLVREAEIEGETEEQKIQNLNTAFADPEQAITDIEELTRKDAKTYYVYYKVVAGDDNHAEKVVTTPIEVAIARKSLESNDITAEMLPEYLNQTYRGSAIVPETSKFVVKDGENELVFGLDKDFVKQNENNINVPADDATDEQKPRIKITGKGNYEGVRYIYFNIVPRNIEGAEIATDDLNAQRVFTGEAIKPAVTSVSFATPAIALTAGTDYDVVYTDSINAGQATITINAKGNFAGTRVFNYNITAAQIDAITVIVNSQPPYVYTGSAIEPVGTAKLITVVDPNDETSNIEYTLTENDYELTFANNVNAGTATATISAKQGGNFTGEPKQLQFEIARKTLTVKVANATKSFGQVDPTPVIESIDGFVGGEDVNSLPANAYTITRANNTEEPGHYAWNVVTNNQVACNYAFENANPQGELTITGATVFIRPQDATKTYGYVLPELNKEAFGFTANGLSDQYNITSLTFTVTDNSDPENPVVKNVGDRLDVGTYTITASDAQTDATQYVFDYSTTATLTIEKKEIILQAQPQTVAFGGEPVLNSVANTYIKMLETNGTTIGKTAFENTYGVWKSDFIENLTWEEHDGSVNNPGYIKVNLKDDYDSKNFTVTIEDGAQVSPVTYTAIPTDLALEGNADDLAKIQALADQAVNVTIDFSSRNGRPLGGDRSWKQYDWMTLTLPFDISVKDLSQKLGYAIVNVIDPSKTVINGTSSEFYGKLTMTGGNGKDDVLAANKPFLVKTADDIDGVINFGSQTIVAPTDLTVDAGQGATFIGTYAPYEVTSADEAKKWFMIGGGNASWAYIGTTSLNTWELQSTEAYLQLPIETQSIIFNFEDVDGGTTAIKSVNADDLAGKKSAEGWYTINGVKLQNAPAEKGVYIKDGKKVVLK